jgi:ribonuclease T1
VKRGQTFLGLLLVAIVVAAGGWWLSTNADPSSPERTTAGTTPAATGARPGADTVAVADLPSEARRTLGLVEAGGPFPYDRDGVLFENRERLLPAERRGYYHEYTVPTPGSDDRGPRRIVIGSNGERYYTADHYRSFRRIAE